MITRPKHVTAKVVFEEFENQPAAQRLFWTYKLEGMAIRNANQVDIINDTTSASSAIR